MPDLVLEARPPTIEQYALLRADAGWWPVSRDGMQEGLGNSLFSVCLMDGDRTVGTGRVVGDGGIYYYIQDVIVLNKYQGLGGGRMIMDAVMGYLRGSAKKGAFVGLMAAQGVEGFYTSYGFKRRTQDRPGMFQVWE